MTTRPINAHRPVVPSFTFPRLASPCCLSLPLCFIEGGIVRNVPRLTELGND